MMMQRYNWMPESGGRGLGSLKWGPPGPQALGDSEKGVEGERLGRTGRAEGLAGPLPP